MANGRIELCRLPAHELGDVARARLELLRHLELGGEETVERGLRGGSISVAHKKVTVLLSCDHPAVAG